MRHSSIHFFAEAIDEKAAAPRKRHSISKGPGPRALDAHQGEALAASDTCVAIL